MTDTANASGGYQSVTVRARGVAPGWYYAKGVVRTAPTYNEGKLASVRDQSVRGRTRRGEGGATNGKEAASLVGDPQGLLVASLSYPVYGNDRATGLAVIPEVPAFRRAIWDTPPAVTLALDYLLARPDVDTTRVELCGASFGVPFAAVVGARDPRVTRVWLVQGGADPRAMIEAGLHEEIPFAPARALVASLANVLASGPRFDPARWVGRISPRPVVMINTEQDERIPRASAEQLHAAARDPK
ncbi:MAG: hypothetical protein U9Q74_12190, partial [Gemmatimonadota bacterium]|nr:hypothetical protein [Gemmatimonadota bacterium]